MPKTVVGLYRDFDTAEQVVRELVAAGFLRENIGLVARDRTHGDEGAEMDTRPAEGEAAAATAAGAGTGAVLGGLAGLVVGLGALAIPGIGPIIAAGPIATALAGAGIGAVAGGLIGALTAAGVPDDEARAYADGVRKGGTLVTLRSSDERAGEAVNIMNRFHPLDINDRTQEFAGSEMQATSSTVMDERSATYPQAEMTSPALDQREMTTGDVPRAEEMSRADFGRMDARGEGFDRGVTRTSRDFSGFSSDFRDHFGLVYGSRGRDYSFYEPGYRYGYDLAGNESYQGRNWNEIEPDAQRQWEHNHPNMPWNDFREAIRHGWERSMSGQEHGSSQSGTGWTGSEGYGTGMGEGRYTDPNNP